MSKRVVVIGSGFAGLSSACHLASKGYQVTLLEKNESAGGRASQFKAEGFTFDMGPSWYWMPEIFEEFFAHFGKKVSDYYELKRLDPAYRIFFDQNDITDIPAKESDLFELFESLEPGSTPKLKRFLKEAEYKYEKGMNEFVRKPSTSIFEFADPKLIPAAIKLQLFTSMRQHVNSLFTNDKIRKILEFPVYFLGALPEDTPALYSLMNYADLKLGTWYPEGGMYKIIEGMVSLATELGVDIQYNQNVQKIEVNGKNARTVITSTDRFEAEVVVAGADYHHVEQHLLEEPYRNYKEAYWDKKVMAPSSLIFYLGVDKKLDNLLHHNLFFDRSFELFGKEIYKDPQWPRDPLFYVCAPSVTDATVAPEGKENLFILIPVAPGLEDDEQVREHYYDMVLERLEKHTGQSIREDVIYKRSFAHNDFSSRYNAFKGNAYGLANTLKQTAVFKPRIVNKKVNNLFYTGQLTVPGPGVPPSIISGEIVAKQISQKF